MPQGLLRPAPDLVPAVALLLDGEVELELCGELLLAVEAVGEVDAADAAVCVDLDPQRLHVVGAVRPPGEVRQVKLDLVPALVQPHRHRADKRLHLSWSLCTLYYTMYFVMLFHLIDYSPL